MVYNIRSSSERDIDDDVHCVHLVKLKRIVSGSAALSGRGLQLGSIIKTEGIVKRSRVHGAKWERVRMQFEKGLEECRVERERG